MRIAIVNYAHAADLTDPDDLLTRYFSLINWADGLTEAGAAVTVLQAFGHDATRVRGGVTYRFVSDGLPPLPHQWQVLLDEDLPQALPAGAAASAPGRAAG